MFPPTTGPIEVALARSAASVDASATLLREAIWDLKLDGWRMVLLRGQGRVELWSRHGTNLTDNFPDIAAAAFTQLHPGSVVDGEVTVVRDGQIEWDQLQYRLGSPTRAREQARILPASYLAFDCLAEDGTDLRGLAWTKRRAALDRIATWWRPPLQTIPYAAGLEEARRWFAEYGGVPGIEGLVGKARASTYQPGRRSWIKIKRYETSEAILGAVTGPLERPESIVVGRYDKGGRLVITGRSVTLRPAEAAELGAVLAAAAFEAHPWPARISAGHFGGTPVELVRVRPVQVVEIATDNARSGGRHRHAIRYVRLRPELTVNDVPLFPA